MSDQPAMPAPAPAPVVTVATRTPTEPASDDRLVAEAMSRSGLLWIDIEGDRAWPAWHAWSEGTAYVVNGPGEQHLPWLPEHVTLVLRSKDTGGRLLRVRARARVLDPGGIEWGAATDALAGERLNAVDDVRERWRTRCAVTALTPVGGLLEPVGGPSHADDPSGAAPPPPSRATTVTWHPRHWRGRRKRRTP